MPPAHFAKFVRLNHPADEVPPSLRLDIRGHGDGPAAVSRINFQRFTPRTLAGAAALRRELAAVRRDGIACSREEFTTGIVGRTVPLRRRGSAAYAAINVAMPALRFDQTHRIATLLHEAAARLMRHLGI